MFLWTDAVDILRESMVAYAHATNGNLAAGILIVTVLARIAIFPLMIRVARASARHQDRVRAIQPELDAVKARFKNDPVHAAVETRKIFVREKIPMVPLAAVLGGLAPAPVLLALYAAVRQCAAVGGRFLWIADISRPDRMLAVLVGAIGVGIASFVPVPEGQSRMLVAMLPALVTTIVLWKMAAGIGLYWGVSSAIGGVQTLISAPGAIRRGTA
jgi:YidC/Oxa1 family membrane protein insertase